MNSRSVLFALLMLVSMSAAAERVKDLATVLGVRENQLLGYGLVVGLDGSGDQTTQTPFTVQSIVNMLTQLGVNLPPTTSLQLRNVAAVMVTATMPAFVKAMAETIPSPSNQWGNQLLPSPLRPGPLRKSVPRSPGGTVPRTSSTR